MALVQVATRIDEKQSQQFKEIAQRLGVTPADALRMFICAFNECKGFPYTIRLGNLQEGAPCGREEKTTQLELQDERSRVATTVAQAAANFPAIRRAFLFGSFARGDHRGTSDIDVRIEYDDSHAFSLYDLARFSKSIEQATGRSVDVVSAKIIKNESLAAAIERDKVLVYERKER